MTVVIGYKDSLGAYLTADSLLIIDGNHKSEIKKIHTFQDRYLGTCHIASAGTQGMIQSFYNFLEDGLEDLRENVDNLPIIIREALTNTFGSPAESDISSVLIFRIKSIPYLYHIGPAGLVQEVPEFIAVGDGAAYAYGAYSTYNNLDDEDAGLSLYTYLQTANKYCLTCSGSSGTVSV